MLFAQSVGLNKKGIAKFGRNKFTLGHAESFIDIRDDEANSPFNAEQSKSRLK